MGESAYAEREGVLASGRHVSSYALARQIAANCGRMVAIAAFVLTVFHPAFFFAPFAAFRKGRKNNAASNIELANK